MKVVILGTAHGVNVSGKESPDGRFSEYAYSRKVCRAVKIALTEQGYHTCIDLEDDVVPLPLNSELSMRCGIVNALCREFGRENCVYVSIHVNAAGADGKWHDAGGWCAYTTKGKTKSDLLAESLYAAAWTSLAGYAEAMERGKREGRYGRKQQTFRTDPSDGDSDLEVNYYVLQHTQCTAVLTENLFQDNATDVAFLESEEGFRAIVDLHVRGISDYLTRV